MARASLQDFGGRTFAFAGLANLLFALGFHTYLHLPAMLEDLGADPVGVGSIFAITYVVAVLARPWVGRTMDTRGRKPVAIAGAALHVATAVGYLWVDRIGPLLIALRVTHGVALGMVFSVMFTIAADVVPAHRRAQGIALFGISGMLPLALGPLMGDLLLAGGHDYTPMFAAIAVSGVVGILLVLPMPETRDPGQARGRSFWRSAAEPKLRSSWFIGLAFAFALGAYFVFLKTFTREHGVGQVGESFSWYAGTAIFLRVFFGGVPERFGLFRVLYPSLVLSSAGLLVLAFAGADWHVNLAGALAGAGHGFAFPIISAIVVARAPAEERGSAISLFTALFDLGVVVGGPTLGFVVKHAGYPTMFAGAGVASAIATLVFWRWEAATAERGSMQPPSAVTPHAVDSEHGQGAAVGKRDVER